MRFAVFNNGVWSKQVIKPNQKTTEPLVSNETSGQFLHVKFERSGSKQHLSYAGPFCTKDSFFHVIYYARAESSQSENDEVRLFGCTFPAYYTLALIETRTHEINMREVIDAPHNDIDAYVEDATKHIRTTHTPELGVQLVHKKTNSKSESVSSRRKLRTRSDSNINELEMEEYSYIVQDGSDVIPAYKQMRR